MLLYRRHEIKFLANTKSEFGIWLSQNTHKTSHGTMHKHSYMTTKFAYLVAYKNRKSYRSLMSLIPCINLLTCNRSILHLHYQRSYLSYAWTTYTQVLKWLIYYYWYLKIPESAQFLQSSWLDEEDFWSHQPISAYEPCSCTWTLVDPVQFWARNRPLLKFPFLSYMAKQKSHHRLHKQHLTHVHSEMRNAC